MAVAVTLFFIFLIGAWVASSVAVSVASYRLSGLNAKKAKDGDND